MRLNVQDPSIAAGFQTLADILVPNSQGLIDADLARHKRDNTVADTQRTYADAARIDADRIRLATEAARTQGYMSADADLEAILSDPAFDPTSPLWRGKIAAAAVRAENGLKDGPAGVTGFTSYVQPNFVPEDQFSNILSGTGVVTDFANTPTGQGRALANDAALNDADNAAALVRDQNDPTKVPSITPKIAGDFDKLLADRLVQMYGEDAVAGMDPALTAAIRSEAVNNYLQTPNADAAIAEVLTGLQAANGTIVRPAPATPAGAAAPAAADQGSWFSGLMQGLMGAPAAAPAANPATAPAQAAPPLTATNPHTGQKIFLNEATGQWEPLGPVKR